MNDTHNNIVAQDQNLESKVKSNVIFDNIPRELKQLKQWVLWRYETRDGKKTKVPYNANCGRYDEHKRASSTQPSTWASIERAADMLARFPNEFDGVGIVLRDEDGFVGIDADGVVGTPDADELLKINSYAEISPSGKGLRMFGFGKLPFSGRKFKWLELYKSKRFLTITGNVVGEVWPIANIQTEVDFLVSRYFPEPEPEIVSTAKSEVSLEDQQILDLARIYDRSGRFVALWDCSEADLITRGFSTADNAAVIDNSRVHFALACSLVFYTRNSDQLRRLLLASGCGDHPKLQKSKYLDRLVTKSLAAQTETYKPSQSSVPDDLIAEIVGYWPETVSVTPVSTTYYAEIDHPSFDDPIFKSKVEPPKPVGGVADLRTTISGRNINWLKPGDIRKRATEQPITWFVDGWIMQGGLHMLAGSSFAGKSQLLADLATAIANGLPFGGMDVTKTPVLMIDCENHCSITDARIKGKIDDDSNFLIWLDDQVISQWLPLTVEMLEELILDYYAATGHTRCVLFADTLRSIFQIDEQDAKQINDLFYPLQRMARKLNVAILLLNHRPKSGASYSGHNAMMAALDMFMVYDREPDSTTSTLKMVGTRLKKPDDIKFYFDAKTNSLSQTAPMLLPVNEPDTLADDFINHFPTMAKDAWTKEQVAAHFPDLREGTLRNRLDEAQRSKHPRLERHGNGAKGSPYVYFRV